MALNATVQSKWNHPSRRAVGLEVTQNPPLTSFTPTPSRPLWATTIIAHLPSFVMPLLTIPYNEAMCLGQGFNSYTQSFCLDQAVTATSAELVTLPASAPQPHTIGEVAPDDTYLETSGESTPTAGSVQEMSQTVTYSSHFIDKLSDVARILNQSPASCIMSGGVECPSAEGQLDGAKVHVRPKKFPRPR